MRAIYYDRQGAAEDVLVFGSLPKPAPGVGEVLVRVHVSGLNPSDIKSRTGFISKMAFQRIIPHQDGAGVIEAVGEGISPDRIGERVWIFEAQWSRASGTAADYVVVPSENAVLLPDSTSFEIGASLGVPALTAHRCLFADGDLRGLNVLIHGGAGVVGSAAIQLAKWSGAWVAATVRRPEHEDIARKAGADLVLNVHRDNVAAEVKEKTKTKGVDRIIDVDLVANLNLNLDCLANGGAISAYAARHVSEEVSIPVISSMIANCAIRFVYIYTVPMETKKAAIVDITECLLANAYNPLIGLILPLNRTFEAHVAIETGAVAGKVLIQIVNADGTVP